MVATHNELANPGPQSAYPSNGCVLNVQGDHAYVVPVILLISDSSMSFQSVSLVRLFEKFLVKVILALIPTLRMMCEGHILAFQNCVLLIACMRARVSSLPLTGTISSSSCFQSLPMNEVYREGKALSCAIGIFDLSFHRSAFLRLSLQ